MRKLAAGLIIVFAGLNTTALPYTLAQVVDSLSKRLDRVVTFHADATVYEHSG